jgi:hypothetical protein
MHKRFLYIAWRNRVERLGDTLIQSLSNEISFVVVVALSAGCASLRHGGKTNRG